jgi:hypothetical protein
MKSVKELAKMNVTPLNKEELQNTFGGAWWEVTIIDGKIVLIFHPKG